MIFDNNVVLAPIAGITDMAFRILCKRYKAGMVYSEMVSAKGLKYGNTRTHELLTVNPLEGRIGVQLFGHEPNVLADMAKMIYDSYADKVAIIDINMGCPAPKIVKNGDGCALMGNISLASDIINKVKKATDFPVSVKFRKGLNNENINAVSFAVMAEQSGADLITVHGRTREQFYEGKADLDIIKQVKQNVNIPVVGNGDVVDGKSAKYMMEYTECDAVMVARAALGNPFIFERILHYLKTGEEPEEVSIEKRIETCLEQARMAIEQKGERIAIKEMRKHSAWYIKGIKNANRYRKDLVRINSYKQLEDILKDVEKNYDISG